MHTIWRTWRWLWSNGEVGLDGGRREGHNIYLCESLGLLIPLHVLIIGWGSQCLKFNLMNSGSASNFSSFVYEAGTPQLCLDMHPLMTIYHYKWMPNSLLLFTTSSSAFRVGPGHLNWILLNCLFVLWLCDGAAGEILHVWALSSTT